MLPLASACLLVFAKRPEPGRVKTRLTALLTPDEAATLYEAFLRDALSAYAGLAREEGGPHVRVHFAPEPGFVHKEPGARAEPFADFVPAGVQAHLQRGDGLGQRMHHAFLDAFAAGYERVAIVGTDHPTLPLDFVRMAFELLREPRRVVLGPSEDGGYYLMGLNECYADLFDMDYSHAAVFDDTLQAVSYTAAEPVVLPPWYDVDTPADLARLAADLRAEQDPIAKALTRRTNETLARLVRLYPALG